jgi:DNA-binding GntR family transcriptional regulator
MGRIEKEGLRDLVYKELHVMIENSRFSPGTRINVEKITEELGVSRTPVWQAIGLLEKEGLIKYIPNVGVFIQELTPSEAIELYSVREVLEAMAARLAVDNISTEALSKLEESLRDQRVAVETHDLVLYSKLDYTFHSLIYQASNNKYLIEMLDLIKKKMRPLVHQLETILDDLLVDHENIFKAFVQKDKKSAESHFKKHNQRMKEIIKMEQNL